LAKPHAHLPSLDLTAPVNIFSHACGILRCGQVQGGEHRNQLVRGGVDLGQPGQGRRLVLGQTLVPRPRLLKRRRQEGARQLADLGYVAALVEGAGLGRPAQVS
jgi:hypothetical protein